jgi:hypothetical protein
MTEVEVELESTEEVEHSEECIVLNNVGKDSNLQRKEKKRKENKRKEKKTKEKKRKEKKRKEKKRKKRDG